MGNTLLKLKNKTLQFQMQNCETKFVQIFKTGRYNQLLQLSDAKIQTEDGYTFDIHRIILTRSSDYFRALFCGIGKDRRQFRIPGISGKCLSNILCYVYTEDIQYITEGNVADLMIAADYLLLKDLHMEIKQSIKANMTEVNCLRILHAAHQISDKDIFQKCFRFIQTRFERIMRCQEGDLADFPLEILIKVLCNRSLYVYNETTVWHAIVEWTQKDPPFRMRFLPKLLLTLAVKDIGEELATEILQHEIILDNPAMKDLIEIKSDFTSNLDALLSFLNSSSDVCTEPHSHRIPLELHLISSQMTQEDGDGNTNINLYITYDENPDLWRKITAVCDANYMIAIGHNVYLIDKGSRRCRNFDLRLMDWVTMENYRYDHIHISVVAINVYIYVIRKKLLVDDDWTNPVEVYDTVNNRWFDGVSPSRVWNGVAVAVDKKIYMLDTDENVNEIMMQVFDPVTQLWSLLSPPVVAQSRHDFALVAYHQKIYLLGDSPLDESVSNAEVFDPVANLWKELPDLPYTYVRAKGVVFSDQFIVYENGYGDVCNTKNVRWNDAGECWVKLGETDTPKDLAFYRFCIVDDVEAIRMITKQNRDPQTQMENSPFN